MTRGYGRWVALCCLALSAGACAPRKETVEPKPAPAPEQLAPAAPQAAPEPQKENPAMAAALDCVVSVPASVRAGEPVPLRFQPLAVFTKIPTRPRSIASGIPTTAVLF